MSAADGLPASTRAFLLALREGPLEAEQPASNLAGPPGVVAAELESLVDAALVHAVTVEGGRQAWGLTARGRSRIAWRPDSGELATS